MGRALRCSAFFSGILWVTGVVLVGVSGWLFEDIIRKFVLLGPNSMSKDMWINTPKIQTSVYIFHVQNQDEVMSGGKPKLVEKGPYVYDEFHHKTNLKWNSNGTVSYANIREYHFNPIASNGTLEDEITLVNAPAGSISYTGKYQMTNFMRTMVNMLLDAIDEKLFVTKTVREIVFDGYTDPLLSALDKLKAILKDLNIPTAKNMDKFAVYYKRNMSSTYDGYFNMFTGMNTGSGTYDEKHANQMYSWNYEDRMSYFPGKCGKIFGNGELFKPQQGKTNKTYGNSKVAMFSNDLCRPILFQYDNPYTVKGILGNRYVLDDMFLANSTENRDNWCFEAPKSWKNPKSTSRLQFPSGVFNMGLCKFNSSTFISQPHFFRADPFYINQFAKDSLHPDEKAHQTSIVIDPQSGIPLEVIARFQANILIEPSDDITLFQSFKEPLFIPAFWFETKMVLQDDMKLQMWTLANLRALFYIIGWTIFALGFGGNIICTIVHQAKARKLRRQGPVLVEEDTLNALVQRYADSLNASAANSGEGDETQDNKALYTQENLSILNK